MPSSSLLLFLLLLLLYSCCTIAPLATHPTTPASRRYDGRSEHVHLASLPGMADRTVTVSSAGKTFSVTGWQVGWAVGPAAVIGAVQRALPLVQFCASTPMQVAMCGVLRAADRPYGGAPTYYEWLQRGYKAKRDRLARALKLGGLEPLEGNGGYFLVADTSTVRLPADYAAMSSPAAARPIPPDWAFCRWLAREHGVIGIPMSAFFSSPEASAAAMARDGGEVPERLVRFAFCKTSTTVDEAACRLERMRETTPWAESCGAPC